MVVVNDLVNPKQRFSIVRALRLQRVRCLGRFGWIDLKCTGTASPRLATSRNGEFVHGSDQLRLSANIFGLR